MGRLGQRQTCLGSIWSLWCMCQIQRRCQRRSHSGQKWRQIRFPPCPFSHRLTKDPKSFRKRCGGQPWRHVQVVEPARQKQTIILQAHVPLRSRPPRHKIPTLRGCCILTQTKSRNNQERYRTYLRCKDPKIRTESRRPCRMEHLPSQIQKNGIILQPKRKTWITRIVRQIQRSTAQR